MPKCSAIFAHFLDAEGVAEAVELYHNVPMQHLDGLKIELHFARTAGTLLPHSGIFMKARRCIKL